MFGVLSVNVSDMLNIRLNVGIYILLDTTNSEIFYLTANDSDAFVINLCVL